MDKCVDLYGSEVVTLALARGWDMADVHAIAVVANREPGSDPRWMEIMSLSHPFNYVDESEIEAWENA